MRDAYSFDAGRLAAAVERLASGRVLIVGDIMLDEYLIGDAERISPEAPIPIVRVQESRLLVGGAGNVARNIKALGGGTRLVSFCGADTKAEALRATLSGEDIEFFLQETADRPTIVKTRVLARGQQMLRIDHENAEALSAADVAELLNRLQPLLAEYPVLIISDYGKGLVCPAFMQGLQRLCAGMSAPPLVLVDPKPQNFPLYTGVHLLTPNSKETGEGSRMPVSNPAEIVRAGRSIMQNLGCERLLTTLGAQGMALFLPGGEVWHIPTMARRVFDVTGAGDTVIATLGLGLAAGLDPLDACVLANYAAGIVVGEVGAATAGREQVQEALRTLPQPEVSRWA